MSTDVKRPRAELDTHKRPCKCQADQSIAEWASRLHVDLAAICDGEESCGTCIVQFLKEGMLWRPGSAAQSEK